MMLINLQNFKAQDESHREMKRMAEIIGILASQMDRLKEVPKSDKLSQIIHGFPRLAEGVVDFIEQWLKSWSGAYFAGYDTVMTELLVAVKHLFVAPHKDKATELRKKLDAFAVNFDRDLLIEIRAEQGIILCVIFIVQFD